MKKLFTLALFVAAFLPLAFGAFENKADRSGVYDMYYLCCREGQTVTILPFCMPGGNQTCVPVYCGGKKNLCLPDL